jgi:hypothetical protein
LLVGVLVYKNIKNGNPNVDNSLGGANTESPANVENENPSVELQPMETQIQAEAENGGGTFTICLDECGNGKCQAKDTECEANKTNCVCSETAQECPQDCKN